MVNLIGEVKHSTEEKMIYLPQVIAKLYHINLYQLIIVIGGDKTRYFM
jgi:hypothetical protein